MFWVNRAAAASSFMPVQATEIAARVDSLYGFLLISSLIACLLLIFGFIYFAYKYRRRTETDKTAYITHNNILEFTWSFIPFVIFMVMFGWGWWVYNDMRSFPEDALEVHVTGQMWSWTFTYKNGRTVGNELYVPVNQPVKLIMTSQDVLHSFFIPAFRIKQDVIPGRYTALWFDANKLGSFQVFCAEYCGEQHSGMLAKVHVVPREQYENWLREDPYEGLTLAQTGQQVFTERCLVCHTTTAETKIGPGLGDLFGKQRQFEDGSSIVADENYIRESVLNPNARVVQGFTPAMPSFAGQLSEQEISGIIEYIKSLSE